jgi:hypothetical protein
MPGAHFMITAPATAPAQTASPARRLTSIAFKALLLFALANFLFAWLDPLPWLGRLSLYNTLLPGRARLPYGENPERAYNLSLNHLDAMFAAHAVAGPKPADEYRVLLLGDSSVWGFLLENEHTLAAQVNALGLTTPDGRQVRAYNLGYPILSLTKDLLLLSRLQRYQPDLIVWLVTLESFPADKQLFPPLVQNNPGPVRDLIARHDLRLDPADPSFVDPDPWQRTIVGQRRALADLLRLQLYGFLWAATGVDQDIPATYTPRQEDLPPDLEFHGLQPPNLSPGDLAFDVLAAGAAEAGAVPLLLVNEPMFVSQGENSDLRYNFFYPRWTYDAYRQLLAADARARGWAYLDLWQAVDNTEYTDSAIHLTPAGSAQLAAQLAPALLDQAALR